MLSGTLEGRAEDGYSFLKANTTGQNAGGFAPQPWEECARVLREAGHSAAARAVLIEKERLQRSARRERVRMHDLNFGTPKAALLWMTDGVLGATIRYGRQPMLAFAWLFLIWFVGVVAFSSAEAVGALKPSDPKIQIDPIWKGCHGGMEHRSQYQCFMEKTALTGYPRFNALVYSADTLIPVVSLEMQSYWLPDDRTTRGAAVRVYLWFHIALGWGLTLLAVAGFSGLVKQDSK
jgi:hypothetical protein